MAKLHNALATTELHNPKGIGVESSTEILLTMSASLGAVSASASIVPHTTDTYNLGSAGQRWNDVIASGNVSSSITSTGSFGRLEIAKNATIDGTLTLAGGTTTIGDAASDTLVIEADLASNLIPDADGTRDLGSAAASWRNIWADGTGSFKNTIITNREYFYDAGGEYISGDGTDLNLVSSADINIPADIGLTFGDDGEKIEGDGTDLTIAGNNINLTAVADVNIPSGVGLTFATAEKIESDGTDLSITVGGSGDINIPANIGLTFGDDGEKIEGDGTDLTIAGNNINLTATADVVVPADVGITFGTGEKIEGNNTDLTVTSGADINLTAVADVNIPSGVGVTFGDDGEKIEGNGTKLTIASSDAIDLTATTDVVIPSGVGLTFAGTEKIESDGTDLTFTVGAGGDINIGSDIGLTFGNDGEKIEGDGTDLTISANIIKLNSTITSGSSTSTGSFGRVEASTIGGNSPLTIEADSLALDTDGNLSGSGTGSFGAAVIAGTALIKGSGQKLYFSDVGGEYISGDGTDLNLVSGADINIPSAIGLTFGNDGEKIEGNGTKLDIAAAEIDFSIEGSGDINIGANIGLTFGDDAEKIEGDGTDLTITGNIINLSPTADVAIPANKGLLFAGTEKIESDGTDLTITVGGSGDINIGSDIGLTFGDDGEKIEGNGTDLTIASSNELNLSATTDVVIPVDVGLHFGDGAEKIESNNTALTINSGEDINLTATTDINVPSDVGLTFGNDGEKIEGDGTDMTIASSGILTLSSGGNTIIETVTLNNGDVTIPGNLTVTGDRIEAQVGSLQVADHTITVGSGSATSALMEAGGIDWGISGSIANLRYQHATTSVTSSVFLVAPKLTVDTITLDAAEIDASGALDIDTGGDLTLSATGDVNIPANIGLTFGNDGEKIEGDGTDLTITGNIINLSPTADVVIPNDKGIQFGGASEKIEGDGTDLTITGAKINLSPTTDVHIPNDKGIVFGDAGEKIEGDGTDLTIASSNLLNLTATTDIVIPTNVGLHFTDSAEKIESDGTDFTLNSGNDINLTATTDINIPSNVGLTFGDDAEKIEGDGTDLTISANSVKFNTNLITGSGTITGSFGQVMMKEVGSNWTNAGNTIADLGSVTTCDINGGTINGITDLAVADGGTGAGTFTDGGILLGSGTSAITATAVLADGEILIGDGTTDPVALDVGGSGAITILGTIATGVWNGTAITGTYIANDTIDSAHYAADSIDAEHYAAGSVDADAIGNDVVNSQHYAAASIDNEHLADNAVDSDELAAGSVDDGHLSDGVATGLAGAGTTATSGVLNVIGGNGITANANDIAVTAAQTTITSIYATDLIMGEDAQTAIDFGTANQISFKTNNAEDFRMVAGGTFHANADVVAYSSTVASDMSLKENITDTKYGLSDIMKLRGVDFDWKREDMGHDVGVLAQEVEAVIPELVKEVDGLNGRKGFKAVDYNKLVPVLIESIKELKLEIDELKKN